MTEDVINDFKQFMAAELSMQLSGFATKEDLERFATKEDLQDLRNDLSVQIADLSNSVAEALDSNSEMTDTQLKDRERRITLLETKAA
jgi:hypothetical protein